MTMQELAYLLLVFCFGWFIVGLIVRKITLEEHVGLSLLTGFGVHSVLYFVFVLYFARSNVNNIFFLIVEVSVVIFLTSVIGRHLSHVYLDRDKKFRRIIDFVLVTLSSGILLYIFIQCVYWPVYEPDTLYLYDFRAQRLMQGDLLTFFKGTSFYQNNLYPPFTSLMHFFLYQVGSVNPKIIYPIILLAFFLVVVGYVKRKTDSNLSGLLAGTLILLTPCIMWNSVIAINNIIFMVYVSIGCLYIFDSFDGPLLKNGNTLIGVLLLALSSWVRREPFWMAPLSLFIIKSLLVRKGLLLVFIALAIVLPISQLWPNSIAGFGARIQSTTTLATKLTESVNVAVYRSRAYNLTYDFGVAKHFLTPLFKSWGFIPFMFIVVVAAQIIIFKKMPSLLESVTLLLSASVLLGIVDFSHRYVQWASLDDSIYRMATITIPLFWVSIVTSKVWKRFF